MDAIASLGGDPLYMDDWNIDICVAATNKCLGAAPGLALVGIFGFLPIPAYTLNEGVVVKWPALSRKSFNFYARVKIFLVLGRASLTVAGNELDVAWLFVLHTERRSFRWTTIATTKPRISLLLP